MPGTPTYYCPECDYNLTGIASPACPECGEALDLENLHQPLIPWVHRQKIGRVRAYWQTVWMVISKNRRLCREMSKPVSYADAQQFRHVTIAISSLVVLPLLVLSFLDTWRHDLSLEMISVILIVSIPSTILFLFVAAHTHTVWFHPRDLPVEKQNRAIALSYYALAPWPVAVIGLLTTIVLWIILGAGDIDVLRWPAGWESRIFLLFFWGSLSCMLAGIIYSWTTPVRMAGLVAHRSIWSRLFMTIALPALWVFQAVLIIGGISAVAIYIMLAQFTLS